MLLLAASLAAATASAPTDDFRHGLGKWRIEAEAPATEDIETAGARAVRWADAVIVAVYGTTDPLN